MTTQDIEFNDTEFFAPVSTDLISSLCAEYDSKLSKINKLAEIVHDDSYSVMKYFIEGNFDHKVGDVRIDKLFSKPLAISWLNKESWNKLFNLSNLMQWMPQARRDQWYDQVNRLEDVKNGLEILPKVPDFVEETVRSTFVQLLTDRTKFFAERVDGVFRELSGDHVTNVPEGFSKRMIINSVLDTRYTFFSICNRKAGVINDLRCVIGKFTGHVEEVNVNDTHSLIQRLQHRYGEWVNIDGNTIRIKLYMKGTVHIEIHPDLCYKLNQVLAYLYPAAIPSEFRKKPLKKSKDFQMIQQPISKEVVNHLISILDDFVNKNSSNYLYLSKTTSATRTHALEILKSIGACQILDKEFTKQAFRRYDPPIQYFMNAYEFSYDPKEVLREIINNGCIPDRLSHQFYPTPESVARVVVELANIKSSDTILEPSAGIGGLLDMVPELYRDNITACEISKLHCRILEEKGYKNVINGDFLEFVKNTSQRFDKIIMNPPFSEGRAKNHVEYAVTLLKSHGRLMAVLPNSFRNKIKLDGFDISYSVDFKNEFENTSISTIVMVAQKLQ